MKLLIRHLMREVYGNIALVFAGLLMLFALFDVIQELGALGRGEYDMGYVLLFVLLTLPSHVVELFPLAILIGTILALAQMVAHSELVVYRASGVSVVQLALALCGMAIPLVLASYLCGEMLAPPSDRLADQMKLKAQNAEVSLKEFRSGIWVKDEHSFVNVRNVLPDTSLLNISIYDFDADYRLVSITAARRAEFVEDSRWRLEEVMQTRFNGQRATVNNLASMEWHSVLNPDILGVLLAVPEQMSAWSLYQYIQHLRDNRQKTTRYEVAMWNKLLYPGMVMVMMLLALPFASQQRREGGVSGKIFLGIVLGLTFHFANQLFSSLGALKEWPPLLSAALVPAVFFMLAVIMLWWTERR